MRVEGWGLRGPAGCGSTPGSWWLTDSRRSLPGWRGWGRGWIAAMPANTRTTNHEGEEGNGRRVAPQRRRGGGRGEGSGGCTVHQTPSIYGASHSIQSQTLYLKFRICTSVCETRGRETKVCVICSSLVAEYSKSTPNMLSCVHYLNGETNTAVVPRLIGYIIHISIKEKKKIKNDGTGNYISLHRLQIFWSQTVQIINSLPYEQATFL